MQKLLSCTLFFGAFLTAQLQINTGLTPQQYVEDVLIGPGVVVSNITYSGQSGQIGDFNSGSTAIGFADGLVMSSGNVADIDDGGPGLELAGQFSGPGDADILAVAQSVNGVISTTFDAAVLEFDFIPAGDTVKFNFVFASDEYSDGFFGYECTEFNDAFGFFVDGPNPAGGLYNHDNLALVPGTNTPITISTIYPLGAGFCAANSYPSYYVNNTGNQHAFNGYLIPIEIKFAVTCGETYHFKFAVADCQDDYLDTGIFLESGSFTSDAVEVSVATVSGSNTIYENCPIDSAVFTFNRPNADTAYTVHFNIEGSAINGVDYEHIADSIHFPVGVDTQYLVLKPIFDLIDEDSDSIVISIQIINNCNDTIYSEGIIYIIDNPEVTFNSPDFNYSCPGTNAIDLEANPVGGVPPFNFSWTDSGGNVIGNTDPLTYNTNPPGPDSLFVEVTDRCHINNPNLDPYLDTVIINYAPYNMVEVNIIPDTITVTCLNPDTTIFAFGLLGDTSITDYIYSWTNGITSNNDTVAFAPSGPGYVFVTATDNCNMTSDPDSVYFNIDAPRPNVTLPNDSIVGCAGTVIDIDASGYGGSLFGGDYIYNWTNIADIDSQINVTINTDTLFIVTVTDECGQTSEPDTILVNIVPTPPVIDALIDKLFIFCAGDSIILDADLISGNPSLTNAFQWTKNTDGAWIRFGQNDIVDTPSETTTYYLTFTDQCNAQPTIDSVEVVLLPVDPISISNLDDITKTCPGDAVNITPITSGGTPSENSFSWNNGSNDSILTVNPSTNTTYQLTVTDACGNTATEDITINIPPIIPINLSGDDIIIICADLEVNSSVAASGGSGGGIANYSWNLNGQNLSSSNNASFTASSSGTILVTVTDFCGFQAIHPIDLIVDPCEVLPPNVITPNEDGINDAWYFDNIEKFDHTITIYNRWGGKVYSSTDYKGEWQAQNVEEGVYFYVIELKGREQVLEGTITVLK